jgi:hypothetical protein
MATYQNIYGYVNATLHSPAPESVTVKTRKKPDVLACFESSLEEIIYKAYWEAYFDKGHS